MDLNSEFNKEFDKNKKDKELLEQNNEILKENFAKYIINQDIINNQIETVCVKQSILEKIKKFVKKIINIFY